MKNKEYNIDQIIRVALIALVVVWTISIISPFLSILVWAVVIAISSYPAFSYLSDKIGGRPGWAAAAIVILLLSFILIPVAFSAPGFAETVRAIANEFKAGTIAIPEASERIKQWPVVGAPIFDLWREASTNLPLLLKEYRPQLQHAGVNLLGLIAAAGLFLFQFFVATIVAGVLLAHHEGGKRLARKLADKVVPESSARYLKLIENTVRGVTTGVVGVAIVQAILAGIGFAVIGIPLAPLWAILCLFLALLQVSISVVLLPMALYVFSNHEMLPAILFLAWCIPITMLDNILKPYLMGLGAEAPMLVIFFGSIGGLISFGFLGLFLGAVVLVIAYDLLLLWIGAKAGPDF